MSKFYITGLNFIYTMECVYNNFTLKLKKMVYENTQIKVEN